MRETMPGTGKLSCQETVRTWTLENYCCHSLEQHNVFLCSKSFPYSDRQAQLLPFTKKASLHSEGRSLQKTTTGTMNKSMNGGDPSPNKYIYIKRSQLLHLWLRQHHEGGKRKMKETDFRKSPVEQSPPEDECEGQGNSTVNGHVNQKTGNLRVPPPRQRTISNY